jgi:hypothetical protein
MPSRTQELANGIGFKKQTALHTALTAADLWALRSTSFNPAFPQHVTETDADDYGKGHEFPTQVFPVNINAPWEWPYYVSSENAAQCLTFGLGNVVETVAGAGAAQYVCVVTDPLSTFLLPATTIVSGLRAGTAGEMLDLALIGVTLDNLEIKFASGPGRASSTMTSRWQGAGSYTNNSGLTIPAATNEHLLRSGGMTVITINGIDYFAGQNFIETTFTLTNNLIPGFYPGAGQIVSAGGNYDKAGRMRYGRRTLALTHTAELESTSTELALLLAGTEGTATITAQGALITGAIYHKLTLQFHRVRFEAVSLGDSNGFTTVVVTDTLMMHPTNGIMTATIITGKTGICS